MKKTKSKLMAYALMLSLTSLTGCEGREIELAPEEEYDVIGKPEEQDNELENGLKQVLDVPGEKFKLVTEYNIDDASKREWRITSDKFLYITMYTQNLDSTSTVYIDNIHIDTSIKSEYATMDGIKQDTMDDRIHNSLMLGFPISDDTYYYGVNTIEGSNQDFITGTFYGYNGYSTGTIKEKRYTENDYRNLGVYANKISVVVDLLVKNEDDKDFHNVSVKSDFLVYVTSKYNEYGTEENTKQKVK